jgi:NitT/TauT family transport system ATP-binding protein
MSEAASRVVAEPAVDIAAVSKWFGEGGRRLVALDRISLEVAPGEFVCLVGASGCGKSTLLNMVGHIDVEGRTALMFQEAALFPWLTAAGNVELALRMQKLPRKERAARIESLLQMVHLDGFAKKRPHELSGGMRQRVALARALAQDADVLLMDEPFGALDAMTRDILHDELERLWLDRGLTVVFVTHNVREAVRLGDRVLVLTSRPGKVAHEIIVDVARPRRIDSPEVSSLAASITDLLRAEVRRHAHDTQD